MRLVSYIQVRAFQLTLGLRGSWPWAAMQMVPGIKSFWEVEKLTISNHGYHQKLIGSTSNSCVASLPALAVQASKLSICNMAAHDPNYPCAHIGSLIPRPRPAFRRLQYGKVGRAWYLFSHEHDLIGKWFVYCSTDYTLNAWCTRQSPSPS